VKGGVATLRGNKAVRILYFANVVFVERGFGVEGGAEV
jgi:hypothetical protein